jgi:hypothetical protein
MRTQQLVSLSKRLKIDIKGIFTVNFLLKNIETIVNKDFNTYVVIHVETHWFGLCFKPNNQLLYIDSLHHPLTYWDESFVVLLEKYNLSQLPFRIQSNSSRSCAYFVLYYFNQIRLGKSLDKASQLFTSNLQTNDIIISRWIRHQLGWKD